MTAAPPTPQRRLPLIIGVLSCAIAVCLVLALLIVGGILLLDRDRRAAAAELETVELSGVTTVAPAEWTDEPAELQDAELLLRRGAGPQEGGGWDDLVTIAVYPAEDSATEVCDGLLDLARSQGLADEYARTLEPIDLDGRPAEHRSWASPGEDGGWARADAYCAEHADGILLVLAETVSDGEEPAPMPYLDAMLEEWRWTD